MDGKKNIKKKQLYSKTWSLETTYRKIQGKILNMSKITIFWIGHSNGLGNNPIKLKTFSSAKDTEEEGDNWKNIYIYIIYLYDKGLTSRTHRELKQLSTKWKK